ncbi:MAG: anhydro-N-acetylmuramic acid kinase [Methylotenera sp.]|uniref:anhydro-N-acetylmuramic acid kinase n=1 Tax=Methylotenera sp. TaxID=2051956 RepID=UPI00248A6D1C|nr:anhydro-N-acetylmuramic acid kinase [Methylotenera sp.]MDI1309055.1 anhydro-N-acetylmuramic acid kinase [Methylotenera sp.]
MAGALFIGLMSGTSLDGVDVALVEFGNPQQPNVLQTHFLAYPPELRTQILALQHPTKNELETTAILANKLAMLYADAVNQLLTIATLSPDKITAIGCHGQTIRHRPELGFTLQIGNPALLAELTGITVVADFRSRDIAAGGQGAPLVPAFHQAIFAHPQLNRAVINIGGIANITYLASNSDLIGFDSGPGNMLLDAWIKQHKNLNYDANGAWARTGKLIAPLLSAMLAEPYLALMPPKSTGRDLFNDAWLAEHLVDNHYAPEDVAFTLVSFTAHTIHQALLQHCLGVDEVYVCGGGAHNTLLMQQLQSLLGEIKIETTNQLGIGIDWVEAIAFAWLAKLCLNQQTASLPEVTGAKGARILGAIYQR